MKALEVFVALLGGGRSLGRVSTPRCRGCQGRGSAGYFEKEWKWKLCDNDYCECWYGITWRKARDDGAMVALVKRHVEGQVRQVGASDPEQSVTFGLISIYLEYISKYILIYFEYVLNIFWVLTIFVSFIYARHETPKGISKDLDLLVAWIGSGSEVTNCFKMYVSVLRKNARRKVLKYAFLSRPRAFSTPSPRGDGGKVHI